MSAKLGVAFAMGANATKEAQEGEDGGKDAVTRSGGDTGGCAIGGGRGGAGAGDVGFGKTGKQDAIVGMFGCCEIADSETWSHQGDPLAGTAKHGNDSTWERPRGADAGSSHRPPAYSSPADEVLGLSASGRLRTSNWQAQRRKAEELGDEEYMMVAGLSGTVPPGWGDTTASGMTLDQLEPWSEPPVCLECVDAFWQNPRDKSDWY